MHNHNNNDKEMKSMMWMMVICCAVPLLLIIVLGAGGKALGAPTWIVFGGVAIIVVTHLLMIGKLHKHSDEENEMQSNDKDKDGKNDKTHGGHDCCH